METREKSSLGQFDKEVLVLNPPSNSKFPTTGALFFGALGRENARNGCTFCDGPHPSHSCKIVPAIDQRLDFSAARKDVSGALRKVICQRPATRRSVVRSAMENITGRYLNHLELTDKSSGTDPAEENTSNTSTRNPEKDDSTIPDESTLVGSAHTSQDTILLQSALVEIAAGSRSCQPRLLFDSESQRRFISQDLANKIGAQPFKREELQMSTFGHVKRTKADFEMVRVCLMTDREEIIINSLVSPVISPPISAHL